ncbi:MAG: hypothetical protein V1706_12815 [Pseudomonadota bacterium]
MKSNAKTTVRAIRTQQESICLSDQSRGMVHRISHHDDLHGVMALV